MAVLVEAVSVIVRRDAINRRYEGGWPRFRSLVPNLTMCTDGQLARVGFMVTADAEKYVRALTDGGLTFAEGDKCIDIAVVDQHRGPTTPCDWLEFARLQFGEKKGDQVSACWLLEGRRIGTGVGIHFSGEEFGLATPPGWEFEGSISQTSKSAPTTEENKGLQWLRRENGVDVYLNPQTGKEIYLARTSSRGTKPRTTSLSPKAPISEPTAMPLDGGAGGPKAPLADGDGPHNKSSSRDGLVLLYDILIAKDLPPGLRRIVALMSFLMCVIWTIYYGDYVEDYSGENFLDFAPSHWLTYFIGLVVSASIASVMLTTYLALPPLGKSRRGDLVVMLASSVLVFLLIAFIDSAERGRTAQEQMHYYIDREPELLWKWAAISLVIGVLFTIATKVALWLWKGSRSSDEHN